MNVRDSLLEKFFRPLAGMVSTMKEYAIFIACFSPPYGDCTDDIAEVEQLAQLSPPYGDCTGCVLLLRTKQELSPPYGDCTLNISQNTAKLKSWMARKYSLYYNDVFFALKRTDTNSFGLPCARGSFMI